MSKESFVVDKNSPIKTYFYECIGASRRPSYVHVCKRGKGEEILYFAFDTLKQDLETLFRGCDGKISLSVSSIDVVLHFKKEKEKEGNNKRSACGSKIFVYVLPNLRDYDRAGREIIKVGKGLVKLRNQEMEREKHGQLSLLPIPSPL